MIGRWTASVPRIGRGPRRRLVTLLFATAFWAVIPACTSDDGGAGTTVVVTVTLSPSSVTLIVGETALLTATVVGDDGATVTFTSSATAVASVSPAGEVTAVAPGSATITARVTGHDASATAQIVVEAPPPPTYIVRGGAMGPRHQNVTITTDEFEAVDLVATVNGVELEPLDATSGRYRGELDETLQPGDSVILVITIDDVTITGRTVVPERPTLTAPADNAVFTAAEQVPVTFDVPSDPDRILVTGSYSCGPNCGTGQQVEVDGAERSATFAAGVLPTNEPILVRVWSYQDGEFTGPVTESSTMNLRNGGTNAVNITVTP